MQLADAGQPAEPSHCLARRSGAAGTGVLCKARPSTTAAGQKLFLSEAASARCERHLGAGPGYSPRMRGVECVPEDSGVMLCS